MDAGQDAESDRYFIVMPICDRSLQDEIRMRGALPADQVTKVVLEVLAGLASVPDIVHRDLKPANILLYDGRWCIADFGIAKFVEDSTSLETLRGSLTPAYGAPEQWEGQPPTHATDIYALGCIVHAMVTGAPPFVGSEDEVRQGHLTQAPGALPQLGDRKAAFVSLMLRKSAASRPTVERCNAIFSAPDREMPRPAREGLEAAAHHVAIEAAAAEAQLLLTQAREREWEKLVQDGYLEMQGIRQRLIDEICGISDEARRDRNAVVLGKGRLSFGDVTQVNLNRNMRAGRPDGAMDVAAWCFLYVTAEGLRVDARLNARMSYSWSTTLAFAKVKDDPTFRWREIAFFHILAHDPDQPFGLNAGTSDFDLAMAGGQGEHRVAFGPVAIDGEDEPLFHERWMSLLAKAAVGKLNPPTLMPFGEEAFL